MLGNTVGRGRFSKVCKETDGTVVKIIDIDDQQRPHCYRAELKALELLNDVDGVIHMLSTHITGGHEPTCVIKMPYYPLTLDHVLYGTAKAKFPPGAGWVNTMPKDRVVHISRCLADALASIHDAGIIHRDIKPENILFAGADASPVLIDFGIAWVPGLGESPKLCDVSTAEYKAPELLVGDSAYDSGVDIWALGCIIAKLCSFDCEALFTPYRGDVRLLSDQVALLGPPQLVPNSTLSKTCLTSVSIVERTALRVRFLSPIIESVLKFESSARPTARLLVTQLDST